MKSAKSGTNSNTIRVNSEVWITGYQEDIGMGIVQGVMLKGSVLFPIVRLQNAEITKRGRMYLSARDCVVYGTRSSLYLVPAKDLTTENTEKKNNKRKNKNGSANSVE